MQAHQNFRCAAGLRPALLAAALVLMAAHPQPTHASLLSELAELGVKAGSKAGKLADLGDLGKAAQVLARLPAEVKATGLAAEALPDGAWRFANAAGEVVTATEAADVSRVMGVLLPELARDASLKPTLLLSADSVFGRAAVQDLGTLDALPDTAMLRLVDGDTAYPLIREGKGAERKLFAEIRPELVVTAADGAVFREVTWRMARPLKAGEVRLLSLSSEPTKGLGSRLPVLRPKVAEGSTAPFAEPVSAFDLPSSLANLRGQTVLVSGRVDGAMLRFTDATGVERSVPTADLFAAAEGNGVDLVLIGAANSLQPGTRTWAMTEAAVHELDAALAGRTWSDLYAGLAKSNGRMEVTAVPGAGGRVRLRATPADDRLPPASGVLETPSTGEVLLEVAQSTLSHSLSNIVAETIETSAPSREVQHEQDRRFIPFLSSDVQILWLFGFIMGALSFTTARNWGRSLWRAAGGPAVLSWPLTILAWGGFAVFLMPLLGPFSIVYSMAIAPTISFFRMLGRWIGAT
jgi:hypothetical protein